MEALEEIDASETNISEVPFSIGGLKKVKKLSFQGCKRSTSNSWSLIHLLKQLFWGRSIYNSLTCPASMFNLESLTELDLSYCNIDDGSILNDLHGLQSLWRLDLSGNKLKNLPVGCISNLSNLTFLFLNSCSELRSLPQSAPSLVVMEAVECGSLETIADGQLLHLFASIDQTKSWRNGETLSLNIPGSEIPSWFENQIDLCLDGEGEASLMIDMPPCGEEILGIGLCIVLDDDKFFPIEPNKISSDLPTWWYDFTIYHSLECQFGLITGNFCLCHEETKSSHLWIVFWKGREELSHILQLSKYSKLPLGFSARNVAKVSVKCGWRVICKGESENSSSSMSQSPIPASEQHNDQLQLVVPASRTPMPPFR